MLVSTDLWQYESCNNQTNDALDAYQRAFDLDPSNLHIKARLQLLRNNGQGTGMPNQAGAPVPQDVHPQHYQSGVGAPPGHQWGPPSGPSQVLHNSAPAPPQQAPTQDWNRRLADMQQPPSQPPTAVPYERRDHPRAPPSQRPASPRIDQLRQYHEPPREAPIRRSPPPALGHSGPTAFPAPQALPQPQPSAAQPSTTSRFGTSTYNAADAGIRFPSTNTQGPSGPSAPQGRGQSPPPEIKPLSEPRPSSPGAMLPHQQYQHHPNSSQSAGIAAGAPPPTAALAAAEAAAARERDDRPAGGIKRTLESDEETRMPYKYAANGESRSRLDDTRHRRPSPPDRKPSPRQQILSPGVVSPAGQGTPAVQPNRSPPAGRREEGRRSDEHYVQPETAHAAPAVSAQPPQNDVAAPTGVQDQGKEGFEAAARKMEVDENYDEEGEDEKRKEASGGTNSPQRGPGAGPAPIQAEA